MQERGWVEGRNLQIDYRWADGNAERARAGATELAAIPVELILSSGTVALRALKDTKVSLPIAFVGGGLGGRIVSAATFSIVSSDLIIRLASKFQLPAIYWDSIQVRGGGLMSYGPDSKALHHAAADYVDRILKGAKPGDLPVQTPNQTDLTINLKTAKALGITIPPSVLLRANEVIR